MTELVIGKKVDIEDPPFDASPVGVTLHKCGDVFFETAGDSWWFKPERWLLAKRVMIKAAQTKIDYLKARGGNAENSKVIAELENFLKGI